MKKEDIIEIILTYYRDQLTNINRSDYSHSQEKLHPGTAGNDESSFLKKWRCIVSSGGGLSTGCGCVPHGSFRCVPPLDTTPLASGGCPPGFNRLWRGWVYRPAPEAPEKGNANEIRGFFGTACRVGLRLCDRNNPKNGLVPHSYAGGA